MLEIIELLKYAIQDDFNKFEKTYNTKDKPPFKDLIKDFYENNVNWKYALFIVKKRLPYYKTTKDALMYAIIHQHEHLFKYLIPKYDLKDIFLKMSGMHLFKGKFVLQHYNATEVSLQTRRIIYNNCDNETLEYLLQRYGFHPNEDTHQMIILMWKTFNKHCYVITSKTLL
jgi:hypothetical protein